MKKTSPTTAQPHKTIFRGVMFQVKRLAATPDGLTCRPAQGLGDTGDMELYLSLKLVMIAVRVNKVV